MVAKNSNKKKADQGVIFPAILLSLAVIFLVFLVVSNWNVSQKRTELKSKIESLQQEIRDLEEKNANLKTGINQTQSEEYLEQIARDQLNLKKPGEQVLSIQTATETEPEVAVEKSFWQKIWEKIGL